MKHLHLFLYNEGSNWPDVIPIGLSHPFDKQSSHVVKSDGCFFNITHIFIYNIYKEDKDMSLVIYKIVNDMSQYLSLSQLNQLQQVLLRRLSEDENNTEKYTDEEYIRRFLDAKKVEGCSDRTLQIYIGTIKNMSKNIGVEIPNIITQDLREYLNIYHDERKCSKMTIDNIRRYLSSFFGWMEEEGFINRNPVKRIHKIKFKETVRETISDEAMEHLRDACTCMRDRAMIDFLYSTGVRIGELIQLNISDLDFVERECTVRGKGDRERKVYFDAKAKIHIQEYLRERTDDNPALFVSMYRPYERLSFNGAEMRIKKIGESVNLEKIHPHKLRRTFATWAIDKGIPVEQVQKLLGHKQIDTTLKYAMVNQVNVKASHRRFSS